MAGSFTGVSALNPELGFRLTSERAAYLHINLLREFRLLSACWNHMQREGVSWQVKVRRRGSDMKYVAAVLAVGTECDIGELYFSQHGILLYVHQPACLLQRRHPPP